MEILTYRSKIDYLCNTYIIKFDKEAFIIDPSDNSDDFKNEIKDLNITKILLTHGHFDHIMGLELFLNSNVEIYISKEDEILLYDEILNESNAFLGVPYKFNNKFKLKYVFDGEEFNCDENVIKVFLNPYHTNGSCSYLLNNQYLFCGDAIFKNGYGRIDLKASNPKLFKENFKKLMGIINEFHPIICPGHGEIFKK